MSSFSGIQISPSSYFGVPMAIAQYVFLTFFCLNASARYWAACLDLDNNSTNDLLNTKC